MSYLCLFVACVMFVELFIHLGLKAEAVGLIEQSRNAANVIRSPDMDDAAKEVFVRRASFALFRITLLLLVKFLVIFGLLWGAYRVVSLISAPLGEAILERSLSPLALVGLTLAAAAYVWARNAILRR